MMFYFGSVIGCGK